MPPQPPRPNSKVDFRRPPFPAPAATSAHGLTLIELLVVLSIIATLAALTMPVLKLAQGSSRRSACLSNEHQAALALTMYADDYNGVYPSFLADPDSAKQPDNHVYWHDRFCQASQVTPTQITWATLSSPYAKSTRQSSYQFTASTDDVFRCPADPERFQPGHVSYEFKMGLATGVGEAQIVSPPEAALLWEEWAFHTDGHESEHDRRAQMNIAFADGHVAWIHLSDTTSARFGAGPDLHWFFVGRGSTQGYTGRDIAGGGQD